MNIEETAKSDEIPILRLENTGFDPYDTASLFVEKINTDDEAVRPEAPVEDDQ